MANRYRAVLNGRYATVAREGGVKDSTEFASDLSPDHMPVTRDVLCEECNGSGTVLVPDAEDPNSVAVIEFLNQQRKDELGLRAGIDAA